MTTMKRQKRVVGDVVEIALGEGFHAYGITLREATYGFYDLRVNHRPSIDQIMTRPVLFRLAVMDSAVKNGRWTIIGHAKLSPELEILPPKFIQDAVRRDQFSIYENGKTRPARMEECYGLLRASVWSPEHVEERINDHLAGRVNRWELQDRLPQTPLVQ